jgi:predicted RNase H-like HicB family nuclease
MSAALPWNMDMEFQVVLERDGLTRHYTATVAGLPIVVDATSKREALRMAREAIGLYLEEAGPQTPSVHAELVTVKV